MTDAILSLSAGSSSVKFTLYANLLDTDAPRIWPTARSRASAATLI